jgi:hypothetical protein
VQEHAGPIFTLELFECGLRIGVRGQCRRGTGASTSSPRSEALDLTDRHAAFGDAAGEAEASLRIVNGEERARVTCGEAAFFEQVLNRRFEFQKADRIRDGGAIFSGAVGDLLLSKVKFVNEALESVGLLDWVEIFALKIFYEGHFQCEGFWNVAQDDRNAVHVRALRGAPAAFASNQLITIRDLAYDERLNNAARLDRARKLVEGLFAKASAGLIGAWVDQIDIDVEETLTQRRGYRRRCWGSQWVDRRCRHRLLRRQRRRLLLPDQCSQSPA